MASVPKGRLQSLDIFRGATIASMILVNNPGSWSDVYPPLLHAEWNGWTFTDTVFPFFLWIVGVALTLSTAKRVEQGADRGKLLGHAFRRALILFGLGLFLSAFPHFDLVNIRIPGVLQRIAVCYLIATMIFLWTSVRGQAATLIGVNVVYWALMMLYPTSGCGAGSLEKGCNFAQHVDSLLLSGHMWSHTKTWDPEGVVSTLPAIATVLFGVLTGHLLRAVHDPKQRVLRLLGYGAGLAVLAQVLNIWMPINKSLWTTTFSVWMAGLAMICFGAWYWLADVQGHARWLEPLRIYGMNAIAVFIFSGVSGDILGVTKWGAGIYQSVFVPIASPMNASLLYAICNVLVCYLVAWAMYRRGWFLKF